MEMDMSKYKNPHIEEMSKLTTDFLGEYIPEEHEKYASKLFLQESHDIVYGPRAEEYGDASVNFTNIARLWTAYILMDKDCMKDVEETFKFTQEDVACMMMLLKIARCNNKEETGEDSLRDIVGYTTILHRFKFIDE